MPWNAYILCMILLMEYIQFKKKLQQTYFPIFIQPTLMNTLTQVIMILTPSNLVMHLNFSSYHYQITSIFFQNTHLIVPVPCLKPSNGFPLLLGENIKFFLWPLWSFMVCPIPCLRLYLLSPPPAMLLQRSFSAAGFSHMLFHLPGTFFPALPTS